MHTKGDRCLHVGFAVIDVNRQGRVDCKSLQEKLENAWIRFQQFHFARQHNSPEPLQNSNRFRAAGKVSTDQLLSAYKGTLREFSFVRMSTVPEIGPASISSYRRTQA